VSLDSNLFLLIAGLLVLIGILASTLTVRLGLPFLLLFLIIGMLAGEDGIGGIAFDDFDQAFLVGNLALAIILLDGGMRTKTSTFRAAFWPSLSLATVGVVLTAGALGLFATWLLGVNPLFGLLLGAIVGSTDAAAVFNLLRNSGIRLNERVGGTLELESGANDPMAILLVIVIVDLIQGEAQLSWVPLLTLLTQQFALGALIGVGGGWLLVRLVQHLRLADGLQALLVVSFGLVVFAGVNRLGGSGYLAVYLVGLMLGNARTGPSEPVSQIMDGLAWLAQAGMFLILGLLVAPNEVFYFAPTAGAIAAFLILIARPLAVLLCLLPFRFQWRERFYISWVGLRGAVPIVLAVYPVMAGLSNAQYIFNVTFAVVLVSLLVQGSTVPLMARWLNVLIPPAPAPAKRHRLVSGDQITLEVDEFRVEPESPVLSPLFRVGEDNPINPAMMALVRDGRPLPLDGKVELHAGDRVWMLLRSEDVDDVASQFSSETQGGLLASNNFYGEFVLHPDAQLTDLASAYGLTIDDTERQLSVAGLLHQRLGRHPVVGDRTRLGAVRLTIRQMTGDRIETVGLKLLPGGH